MTLDLFRPIVVTDELAAATGSRAWLAAMLEAESALAGALADVGVIPAEAAAAIGASCADPDRFDLGSLGRAARDGGNPVIPLVAALTEAVPGDARAFVHWGATSQDILDTAAALVSRRAVALVDTHLAGLASACAAQARRHRATLMPGRTLLQAALPITFGFKAAGWLAATLDARRILGAPSERLAGQLGGAVGTLAALGADGPAVARRFAQITGLPEPLIPWHTARQRVAELGCALAIVAGTAAKITGDIALLAQTEVGEAAEPAPPGRGGSSTLPHKRNPVAAAAVSTAARRCSALVPVLLGALVAEHERALGGWQAEWETLSELLALAGSAAARAGETVAGLEVHVTAMAANLARGGGVLLAERVSFALAAVIGRAEAKDHIARLARRVAEGGDFAAELRADPVVAAAIDVATLDDLLEPAAYLGATDVCIDRVLARFEQEN